DSSAGNSAHPFVVRFLLLRPARALLGVQTIAQGYELLPLARALAARGLGEAAGHLVAVERRGSGRGGRAAPSRSAHLGRCPPHRRSNPPTPPRLASPHPPLSDRDHRARVGLEPQPAQPAQPHALGSGAHRTQPRDPSESSRRTIAAPAPNAASLARATVRGSGAMPQLVEGHSWSGSTN